MYVKEPLQRWFYRVLSATPCHLSRGRGDKSAARDVREPSVKACGIHRK